MKKLLVLREDHLGDLILTTPLIRSLAENGYEVDVLARKANTDVLFYNPHIHKLYSIEDIVPSFPSQWIKMARWLREKKYDTLVLPHAKPKELVYLAAFSGIKRRVLMQGGIRGRISGSTCLRSNLYEVPRHMSDVWLDIARHLDIGVTNQKPEIFLTHTELEWGRQKLARKLGIDQRVIGLHPGSAGNTCNLPFDEYGHFVRLVLNETDYKLVITGSSKEKLLIDQWPSDILRSNRVWISAGELNIRELASIIKQLFVYVCPGTGPLHIANAMDTCTFSPFCSRVGHNNIYWGNTNGKGKYINFKTQFCSSKKVNCLFLGACNGNILFEHFKKLAG